MVSWAGGGSSGGVLEHLRQLRLDRSQLPVERAHPCRTVGRDVVGQELGSGELDELVALDPEADDLEERGDMKS